MLTCLMSSPNKLDRIPNDLLLKAVDLEKLTGLSKTKSYGILGSVTPRIIDHKIFPATKGGKKRVMLLGVWEFEF